MVIWPNKIYSVLVVVLIVSEDNIRIYDNINNKPAPVKFNKRSLIRNMPAQKTFDS